MSSGEKLQTAYRDRFGSDAPSATFYYSQSYKNWMFDVAGRSPQKIGGNIREAIERVLHGKGIAALIEEWQ